MIEFRFALMTGVVDALAGQRHILCKNLGNPDVYKGIVVWCLDRGMEARWVYTVSRKQWKILGKIALCGNRPICGLNK